MIRATPQVYARAAGFLYLLNILAGLFGEVFVRGHLVVAGDPVATAHNILAHQVLFRCGIAGDLFMHLMDVPAIVLFYVLLRPVSPDLSLLTAFFNLVQTSMLVANKVQLLAALAFLTPSATSSALSAAQLQQLAFTAVNLHEEGFGVGLIFFGVTCLLTGYLIFRSSYLPRTIGVLQGVAGVCYLMNSFALILAPELATRLAPFLLPPAGLSELATCLWFLFRGIDRAKWNERIRLGPLIRPLLD